MLVARPLVVTMLLSTVPPVDCKCAAAAAGLNSRYREVIVLSPFCPHHSWNYPNGPLLPWSLPLTHRTVHRAREPSRKIDIEQAECETRECESALDTRAAQAAHTCSPAP